ncbi:MAG TPA: hypothetical protein VKD69_08875 [Vicinamibacterales bacterium]|nr:hypothetical protein [Vicinamibacterales bacterium]
MLNFPPGAIVPEVHTEVFETELCATESLLVHVTVPPTATVTGLGEYAVVVKFDDPDTIETWVPDGLGEVGDGESDEPQAAADVSRIKASERRRIIKPPPLPPASLLPTSRSGDFCALSRQLRTSWKKPSYDSLLGTLRSR